jgi:restriction system protein
LPWFTDQEKKRLLEQQTSLDSIRLLTWQDFELLVAQAYRRKGFQVIENGQRGADGGIDLIISKEGQTHIVQCKQWRTQKIGVKVVREMFGVLTAEVASTVIIICCGDFTADALNFANHKPIELINGKQLAELVAGAQCSAGIPVSWQPIHSSQPSVPKVTSKRLPPSAKIDSTCPNCTSELVLRTAKVGPNAGNKFLGCSSFPACRFIHAA